MYTANMVRSMIKYRISSALQNIQSHYCSTLTNTKKLDGKVAIVTASTDGWVVKNSL